MKWDLTIEIIVKEKTMVLWQKKIEYDNSILLVPSWVDYYLQQYIADLWKVVWVDVKNSIKHRLWRM
jgi:hypothetical protein